MQELGGTGGRALPVVRTAFDSYRLARMHSDELLRLAAVPFGFSFLVSLLALHGGLPGLLLGGLGLLSFALSLLYAVNCHRLVLLGRDATPRGLGLRWARRETAYLVHYILLALAAILVGGAPAMLLAALARESAAAATAGMLVSLAASFAALYLMVRLMPILPATAIDRRYGVAAAWRDTAGNGLRIVAVNLLVMLPPVALLVCNFYVLRDGGVLAGAPLAGRFIGELLLFAVLTVSTIAYSLVYRHLAPTPASTG